MPKTKDAKNKLTRGEAIGDSWRDHNIYDLGVSPNRIVTRSQTAFNRIKNTNSDLELFADETRHHPPHLPHLLVTLKGPYGAIPNTIITRSTGQQLEVTKELCDKVNEYKKYKPAKGDDSKVKEKKPSIALDRKQG